MNDDAILKAELLECANIAAGFPFRGAVDRLASGTISVIQMRNIDDISGVDWAALASVDLPTKRQPDLLLPGDVILSARGRRYSALALTDIPAPTVCSQHFYVLRVRKAPAILPGFLAWQINQRPAQDYLQQAATGSHALSLTRSAVAALPIMIPSMHTQKATVALADAAQREVAALQALIDNRRAELEAVATQILNTERPFA